MKVFTKPVILLSAVVISVAGCATIQGTVSPIEGGNYKSFAQSQDKASAMRMADNDAKVTCKEAGKKSYVVISQEDKKEGPEEVKVGNQILDAAISLSKIGDDTRAKTKYEVTTVFKCE